MKYKATEKFKELDSLDNYKGLGRKIFEALESGKSVEIKNPPKKLIDEKYIEGGKK